MLEKGDKFITELEEKRIVLETQHEQMFHGVYHYNKTIKVLDGMGVSGKVDPLVPLPAVISEINGDLLFGEFPGFKWESDTVTDKFSEWLKSRRTFSTDYLEAATADSYLGTVFQYLFNIDGKTHYKFIRSNKTLWTEDMFGLRNVKFFELIEVSDDGKSGWYRIQEHDYMWNTEEFMSPLLDSGRQYKIQNYLIKVEFIGSNKIRGDIKKIRPLDDGTPVEEITELDFIPIIKIANLRQMGQSNGKSDYQGKEQLFAEIDNRVDQINYVLQENVEPWTVVPPGILDENGNFNKKSGKMIEGTPGGSGSNDISVRQWDAQLTSAFDQIKMMIQLVLFTSRISNPIAGFFSDDGGQVESGRALKWRSINTFSMINRKRKNWEEALQTFFVMLTKMDKDLNGIEADGMMIIWKDGLPQDNTELVDNITKEIMAGTKSKLTGTMQINEIDKDTAQQEQDQIGKENQDNANIQSSKFRIEV